jgi:hypothetical protein
MIDPQDEIEILLDEFYSMDGRNKKLKNERKAVINNLITEYNRKFNELTKRKTKVKVYDKL